MQCTPLRNHAGPGAKEQALADYEVVLPHREALEQQLREAEGAEEKRRRVKEALGALLEGDHCKLKGMRWIKQGWQAVMKFDGKKYCIRTHTGINAKKKAAADYNAMLPFRDKLMMELRCTMGPSERQARVMDVWSRAVGIETIEHKAKKVTPKPSVS